MNSARELDHDTAVRLTRVAYLESRGWITRGALIEDPLSGKRYRQDDPWDLGQAVRIARKDDAHRAPAEPQDP